MVKVLVMNPRLVMFAVELQNGEKIEKKEEVKNFKFRSGRKFFNFFRMEKVTVLISKVD